MECNSKSKMIHMAVKMKKEKMMKKKEKKKMMEKHNKYSSVL